MMDMMSSSNGAAGMSNIYRNMQSPGGMSGRSDAGGLNDSRRYLNQQHVMGRTMEHLNMKPRLH